MELQAFFSLWARLRIWSSTCIRLLPISTNTLDNWRSSIMSANEKQIKPTCRIWSISIIIIIKKISHFSQLSDIFHKPLHHPSNVQYIYRVSEACSLQGVCTHLMCHSYSIRSIDGHLLKVMLRDKEERDNVKWTHYSV